MPTNTNCRIRTSIALACCGAVISVGSWAGPGDARAVSRVEPEFPREALQAGAEKGRVKARW